MSVDEHLFVAHTEAAKKIVVFANEVNLPLNQEYENVVKGWTKTATRMENTSQESMDNTEFVNCENHHNPPLLLTKTIETIQMLQTI